MEASALLLLSNIFTDPQSEFATQLALLPIWSTKIDSGYSMRKGVAVAYQNGSRGHDIYNIEMAHLQ